MKNILYYLAIASVLAACQSAVKTPASSAAPALEKATASLEVVKVEANKTTVALVAAQAAPTLPAAKVEVAKAQVSNGAVLEAAGGAAVAVSEAKPLAAAHEKNEAAAIAENVALKDADNDETKKWLRGLAVAVILGGALGAYLYGNAGSIIRAIASGATGLILGIGLFWAAEKINVLFEILGWTVAIAAVGGVIAAVLHYRKHGGIAQAELDAKQEALDALARVAQSSALGKSGTIDLTDPQTILHLRGTVSDKATDLLAKLI